VALFPRDLARPPREWGERAYRITRWTEMPRGGHFPAHEEPALLASELREFFRPLRCSGSKTTAFGVKLIQA
jgi:pimeloyl-ACP methyl ester carboxylesterase